MQVRAAVYVHNGVLDPALASPLFERRCATHTVLLVACRPLQEARPSRTVPVPVDSSGKPGQGLFERVFSSFDKTKPRRR